MFLLRKINTQSFASTFLLSCFGILPLIFYPHMMWQYHASKEFFLQFILIIILGIQVFQVRNTKIYEIRSNYLDFLFSFKSVVIIALYFFLKQYYTIPLMTDILISLLLFYWLIQASLLNYEKLEKRIHTINCWYWVLAIVCIFESGYGLLQYFKIIPFKGDIVYESVIIGTLGNANAVAGYLAASLPIIIGLYFLNNSKLKKNCIIFSIVICSIIIILTKSRGAWIALSCGLMIYFYPLLKVGWKSSKKASLQYIIIGAFFCVTILGGHFLFKLNESSSLGRIFLWKITAQMISDSPVFGIGYGNYPIQYLEYQQKFFENPENNVFYEYADNIKQAHNEYLHVFAETGIVGIVLFVFIIIFFYIIGIRIISSNKNNFIKQTGRMLLSSTTVILVHSFFDCPLQYLPISLLFCFNLAIISVLYKYHYENTLKNRNYFSLVMKQDSKKYIFNIVYFVLVILFCTFATARYITIYQQFQAYRYWHNGMNLAVKSSWKKSIESYKKALSYSTSFSRIGELRFHLAGAYVMNCQYIEAIPEFEKAKLIFNDKNIYLSQGMAHQKLGDYKSAEKCYQKTIGMFPNLLFSRLLLGQLYYNTNQKTEAINMFQSIMSIKPKIQNKKSYTIKETARDYLEKLRKIE